MQKLLCSLLFFAVTIYYAGIFLRRAYGPTLRLKPSASDRLTRSNLKLTKINGKTPNKRWQKLHSECRRQFYKVSKEVSK